MQPENRIGTNRPSPKNEEQFINAYLAANPAAKKSDKMDVSAVKTKDGVNGYGLLPEAINRSRDRDNHRITDFIATSELKKAMSKQ